MKHMQFNQSTVQHTPHRCWYGVCISHLCAARTYQKAPPTPRPLYHHTCLSIYKCELVLSSPICLISLGQTRVALYTRRRDRLDTLARVLRCAWTHLHLLVNASRVRRPRARFQREKSGRRMRRNEWLSKSAFIQKSCVCVSVQTNVPTHRVRLPMPHSTLTTPTLHSITCETRSSRTHNAHPARSCTSPGLTPGSIDPSPPRLDRPSTADALKKTMASTAPWRRIESCPQNASFYVLERAAGC